MNDAKLQLCDLLFNDGEKPVEPEDFIGRHDLRQIFEDHALKKKITRDYVFIIEGPTGFGKSSFAKWCLEKTGEAGQEPHVIFTLIDNWKEEKTLDTPERFFRFISSKFFGNVFDNILQTLKQKNVLKKEFRRIPWDARDLVWNMEKKFKVSEIVLPWVKVTIPISGSPHSPTSFLQYMQRMNLKLRKYLDVTSYVFMFDNFTLTDGIVNNMVDLIMELKTHKWADDFPNVMFVFLPLPGAFKGSVRYGQETLSSSGFARRVNEHTKLTPFTRREIEEYIDRKFNQPHVTESKSDVIDPSFVPALYFMSGGIPRLMNHLGYLACRIWGGSDAKKLGSSHVFEVETHTETKKKLAKTTKEVVRDAYGFNTEEFLTADSDIDVYSSFYTSHAIDYSKVSYQDRFIKDGLTKEQWKTKVLNEAGNSTRDNIDSFERIWQELVNKELLVETNSRYMFCAEAVRKHCVYKRPK